MTVETANKIEELDASLPAGGNDISEGDNHLRLLKSVLKTAFSFVLGDVVGQFVRVKSDATGFETVALGTAAYKDQGTGSADLLAKSDADTAYAPRSHITNYSNPHQVSAAQIGAAAILAQLLTVDGAGSGLDADLLDGKEGSQYWDKTAVPQAAGVYTGSSAANTAFPVGDEVMAQIGGISLDRNGSATVYLHSNSQYYTLSASDGTNSLAGTWRSRGRIGDYYKMMRVS